MICQNGNTNSLVIGHWNGGSAFIGKSSGGVSNMGHIKLYLETKHKIDVLGYRVEGYDVTKSEGRIARLICYVKFT